MALGRTIKIYLDDGSVSGIRIAEILNWTGQAISSPRSRIKELRQWDESQKPGAYFLFGRDEESGDDAVYIGESENVCTRLSSHDVEKDFWNEVILFTSKDANLTKAHVRYLESRFCELTRYANRYILMNGTAPQAPVLPRGERDAMEEFIENVKVLLGVMRHRVLEPYATKIDKSDSTNEQVNDSKLYFNTNSIEARAIQTDEGIVVLSGSYATANVVESLKKSSNFYVDFRTALLQKKILVQDGKRLIFTKDQLFSSPSQAASFVSGSSKNGRICWKTVDGKTIKDLEES